MRVLLDECVPRALRKELPGHEVKTVAEAGWAGVKNGELLELAARQFDVFLTVDRNLEYQQTSLISRSPSSSFTARVMTWLSSTIDASGARHHLRDQARNGTAYSRLTNASRCEN
jgi:hypothetical protein